MSTDKHGSEPRVLGTSSRLDRLQELAAHLADAVDLMATIADTFSKGERDTLTCLSRVARTVAANEAEAADRRETGT